MKGRIFILVAPPPDQPGGVERLVSEMTRLLEVNGYEVQMFHAANSIPAWLQGAQNLVVRRFSDALIGFYVGREAKRRLADDVVAIISHGPVGWYPFRVRTPTKRIHFYHGTYWAVADAIRPFISFRGYIFLKWWAAMLLENWSGRGKLLLCNSEQTKEEIVRRFHRECHTVWLPMDTDHFAPREMTECRRTLGLPQEKPIGLFAGSLEPHKGFRVVRALMESLSDVHWVLLIRGQRPDLDSRPNVTLLGNVGNAELPLIYGAADFLVCPSRYEPYGYVVAEALACGTPVVASPTGASLLFLDAPPLDRLLIASPEDIDAFRRAVLEVLSAREDYRQIVLERIRPRLKAVMSPDSWWRRVAEVTGL